MASLHFIQSARFVQGSITEGAAEQIKNGHGARVVNCIHSFIKIWYIALGWVHLMDIHKTLNKVSEGKRVGRVK